MDLGPYCRTFQPDASSPTHTHTNTQNARICASGIRKTDIPVLFFNLFWDFFMYFDIFGFVSAKKKKNTCAINRQTVVVTSLKMASLDHSKLTSMPQIDISA